MNPIVLRNIALVLKKVSGYIYDISYIIYFVNTYRKKDNQVTYTRNKYLSSYIKED